ncbi:methyl-accepting chemotaxis protein [Neptunomonas japonica]|uniref:methyl-accepting chemotaxis protein n=1 Tax=Neptunomonas japonica TaxID=417574 RepID=UPI0003FC788A|nr:methyl-accepting chemotaxis protein [Neptunomonas japonica]
MFLKNFSIRNQLIFISALPMLAIIIIINGSLNALKEADVGVGRIYDDRIVPLKDLKIIADNYAIYVIDAVNKANAGTMPAPEALLGIRNAREEIKETWAKFMATTLTTKEARLANEANVLFIVANSALDPLEQALQKLNGSNPNQLDKYDGPLYEAIDPISDKISELIDLQLRVAGEERAQINEAYQNQVFLMIAEGTAILLILIIVGYLIYKSINKPLTALNQAMSKVATESDLTLVLASDGKNELAVMSENFNTMLNQQRSLISEISNATSQLAVASEQMTSVSNTANQSIDSQRLEIEQVASAMNEMVSSSQEIAGNAEQADHRAQETREQADIGNNVVGIAVAATNALVNNVADISERIKVLGVDSDNIGSIVDVINDIADQTNLLALNAAIEAARAGDQGRGFAVVADEVRTLAQRTQTSTTEIRETIERLQNGTRTAVSAMTKSQEEAAEAGNKATEVNKAFEEITLSVTAINEMNTHIASASEEQTSVCEEINRSLVSIHDSSQVSSDGASQISTASLELASLASELSRQVAKFKT